MTRPLSRRQFLTLVAAASAAAACTPAPTPSATPSAAPTTTPVPSATSTSSPMPSSTPLPPSATPTPAFLPATERPDPDPMGDLPEGLYYAGTVAPDVLALKLYSGVMKFGEQIAYEAQAKDILDETSYGGVPQFWVYRGGKCLGALVGRPEDKLLATFSTIEGDQPGVEWLAPEAFSLAAEGEADVITPLAVYRKSKPTAMGQATREWRWDFPRVHHIYLKFPRPLATGKLYTLNLNQDGLLPLQFRCDPENTLSEAIHVSQIGFRPDDPAKVGFLSCWLGDGGALPYPETPFRVVEHASGKPVFEGLSRLQLAASTPDGDAYDKNYTLTDVHLLDFSPVNTPGEYRLYVKGVGISRPFVIAADAWQKAFTISSRGFYHQRSGIELGPPYTDFQRPRCFHPADGVKVYASTCPLIDSGNGLNARGSDNGNFGNLVKGKTDDLVENAWGGYFDAGDWDRRIQHLEATRLQLELAEMFPETIAALGLNIPESGNGLPDLINEALWNIDCYRRMQLPDGGIRGGIESSEHPRFGETSWLEQLTVMAYAPDFWSSYVYASAAARAAGVLAAYQPALAAEYQVSALQAMDYAEAAFAVHDYDPLPVQVPDARNLAAADLFKLTGDARWHEVFLATTRFTTPGATLAGWPDDQRDACFTYLRTNHPDVDAAVQEIARTALLAEADFGVALGARTGFRWSKPDAGAPISWGGVSAPNIKSILRAHALTGDEKYLQTALLAAQVSAGANPLNLCFTTGVGHTWPKYPLWIDSFNRGGMLPPPGLTVYGPLDIVSFGQQEDFAVQLLRPHIYPAPEAWPALEFYFDVFMFPQSTEFTVMQTMGPNSYTWGYLAARG